MGGVRLFDIPGVIYPEEMLKAQPGVKKKDGKPYRTPPSWGITTREAAAILHCSASAARASMHKNRISYRIVSDDYSRRFYWRKSQVEKLAAERLPQMKGESAHLITSMEAIRILGVARSSLQRYVQRGVIKAHNVRYVMPDGSGSRRRSYFERAAVQKLAYRLAAIRRHAQELDELLLECDRRFEMENKKPEAANPRAVGQAGPAEIRISRESCIS